MQIYWRALIGYGFVFWIVLCITDFLGVTNIHKYSKDLDELYDKPVIVQRIERGLEPHISRIHYKGVKFGWSLLVWNILTFLFSVLLCTISRTAVWICWGFYRTYRNKIICSQLMSPNRYTKCSTSSSKIPVMIKPLSRLSDTNLAADEKKSDVEKSCPNLLTKRSCSNLSTLTDITAKTCRTLYKKDIFLYDTPGLCTEEQLEKQCRKLKEELHRLQTTSLKEHAILSRKLDSVTKDKKEMSKYLNIAQKENRAAKQQLEEMLQEKTSLIKKLETATKEFKCNTKTKKIALAKLEEVSNNVEELRQELEQVSRDKEILQKKLKLLEVEYNKLHERYILSQQNNFTTSPSNTDDLPERDQSSDKCIRNYERDFVEMEDINFSPAEKQAADVIASVSQTELDMKKIQEKIKQLEKNLENLNVRNTDFQHTQSFDNIESELSLSPIDNTTDSLRVDDESGKNYSEFSSSNSPRYKYWSEKVADLIGKNNYQFAKIQALASKMQEKARFLGNIRERTESTEDIETTDSDEVEPKRLVSSSIAFKNFLKSLNKLDETKKELPRTTEVYF